MTLTPTGPSGFHIKPVVSALTVVAFLAGVYAISQQFWTDSQPSASAPADVSTEAAEPYAGTSDQLVEGLGDGPVVERSLSAGTASDTPTVSGGPQE